MGAVQDMLHLQDVRQNHDGAEQCVYDLHLKSGSWVETGSELLPELRKAGYGKSLGRAPGKEKRWQIWQKKLNKALA